MAYTEIETYLGGLISRLWQKILLQIIANYIVLDSKFCNKETLMIILDPSEVEINNVQVKWHCREQVCSCSVKQLILKGPKKVKSHLQLKFSENQNPDSH